jgi:hypothetical protein
MMGRWANAVLILIVLLMALLFWAYRSARSSMASEVPPEISSVSRILPQSAQNMVIRGSGFGFYTRYENLDIPFIAVRDKSAGWSAGRTIPQNADQVTLSVRSWDDKQIIVSGFSGAFGSGRWKFAPGDEIEIAVWNPQSGHGPALYHLTVSTQPEN